MSPPWGGPDYSKYTQFSLSQITGFDFNIFIREIFNLFKRIILVLPKNIDMSELIKLPPPGTVYCSLMIDYLCRRSLY